LNDFHFRYGQVFHLAPLLSNLQQVALREELAERTGRKKPNLSRTLKTMEHYGLVQITRHNKKLVPRVRYQRVTVLMELRGVDSY